MKRLVRIFVEPGMPIEYVEGDNCDRIDDARSQYPIVKVFVDDKAIIYKGFPYELTVEGAVEKGRE